MVRLSRQDSTVVYVVLVGERRIGRVVAPAGEPALGRGARTVLLQRVPEGGTRGPEVPVPTGGTATARAALELRSFIFAADSMQGRRLGPPGNDRGNAYSEGELARPRLRPAPETPRQQ